MVTVERFLIVHEGKLYELRTDGDSHSCVFHRKHNGGPCAGCMSNSSFSTACKRMAEVLGTDQWNWRELKWKEES